MQVVDTIKKISDRETEVLGLISHGLTALEIATELFISPHTVISHKKHLLVKLDATNQASLVRKGFELGYLTASINSNY